MADLGRHESTKFMLEERNADKAPKSPFFHNLEKIGGAYEFKLTVMIKRTY